jgi:5-formyltetrahydrofolate cyclo-ligase
MTTSPRDERARIRTQTLQRRDGISQAQIEAWATAVIPVVQDAIARHNPAVVFTYLDIPNEVPTHAIAAQLLADGRRVAVPYVTTGSKMMTLYEIRNLETDLKRGIWGIPVPRKTRCPECDPSEVNLALVPCVAIDERGYRIGHGAGYYDRFLGANPHIYKLCLAFEVQRVSDCLPQAWDVPMDALITEAGLCVFRQKA